MCFGCGTTTAGPDPGGQQQNAPPPHITSSERTGRAGAGGGQCGCCRGTNLLSLLRCALALSRVRRQPQPLPPLHAQRNVNMEAGASRMTKHRNSVRRKSAECTEACGTALAGKWSHAPSPLRSFCFHSTASRDAATPKAPHTARFARQNLITAAATDGLPRRRRMMHVYVTRCVLARILKTVEYLGSITGTTSQVG